MASFTKFTICVLEILSSFHKVKRIVVDDDMDLESHVKFINIVKEEEVLFKIEQGSLPV